MLLVRLLEDALCVFIYHCVLADWRFSDSVVVVWSNCALRPASMAQRVYT